ncbi:serine/threonine-protein phosphatase [Thermoleophilia bacterium SCSIO 60948]|nr:serine/threonine-protein phosphatase [Thermoleophilia bacterium SCSIO 60948]
MSIADPKGAIQLVLDAIALSETGQRPNNEDAAYASPRMVAVADGVGGHAAGEVASHQAIGALHSLDKRRLEGELSDALAAAIDWGNAAIALVADAEPATRGMATTLSAVAISNEGCYVVANVGDSRAYLLRGGMLDQLTTDDSLVGELVRSGQITPEEATVHPQRSVVLKSLDGRAERDPTLQSFAARLGDRLLVCSDGLSDYVGVDVITDLLIRGTPADAGRELIDRALADGSNDNVSVAIADVVEGGGPAWAR